MEELGEEVSGQKHHEAKALRQEWPQCDQGQRGSQCGWRLGARGFYSRWNPRRTWEDVREAAGSESLGFGLASLIPQVPATLPPPL